MNLSIRTQDGTGNGREDDRMLQLVADVLVAVVLTTVEVVALLLAFFAIGITGWAQNKGRGRVEPSLERIFRTTAVVAFVLPLACAYGLFLLRLPIAAAAQCLLVSAIPFWRPIWTGVKRLREGVTRHRRGLGGG
ncbi:DUF6234 family protein [Kitasatospora aureofaciens]|uniref:DUF6234 family protein n=1 Tax=Kitasatospora aureofaciens TaxID=1894 RepID=UPI0033C75427